MRYIDLKKLTPPQDWLDKAQKAYEETKQAVTLEERSKIIDRHADLWASLKRSLRALSHKKCWYCESWEARSDTAVDHYRPKNAILESPSHPGYWWLAFRHENYRYCCKYCNERRKDPVTGHTGGKGTAFPLANESKRVFTESSVRREEPLLLDPTVAFDVGLITFDPDGTAQPRWAEDKKPHLYTRAKVSIILYHLNHTDLKERRQILVCNRVSTLVERGDRFFEELDHANQIARDALDDIYKDLLQMIAETAEYSATAKATLNVYRDRPWVETVLDAA